MRSFVACAVLVLAGCKQPGLNSSVGVLHVTPSTLDFGAVYSAKESRTQTFSCHERRPRKPRAEVEPAGVSVLRR